MVASTPEDYMDREALMNEQPGIVFGSKAVRSIHELCMGDTVYKVVSTDSNPEAVLVGEVIEASDNQVLIQNFILNKLTLLTTPEIRLNTYMANRVYEVHTKHHIYQVNPKTVTQRIAGE